MFEIIKKNINIDFLSRVNLFFIVSGVLCIISLLLIFSKGFNYGIDFAGGTLVQVRFNQPPDLNDIRNDMEKLDMGDVIIQNFGDENGIIIRVERTGTNLQEITDKVQHKLLDTYGHDKIIVERVEQVGPQVGDELKKKAFLALIYALIGILLYITVRFEFVFSVGAVAALFHDVLITLGIFVLLGKEINLPIIAALLTIVGYSLNDTIVVFDRVREKIKSTAGKRTLRETMNNSINETLSRTVLTSLTTLMAVLALYIFGGAVINGFAFTLLIGVIIGTYSSIGIAGSLVYFMKTRKIAKT